MSRTALQNGMLYLFMSSVVEVIVCVLLSDFLTMKLGNFLKRSDHEVSYGAAQPPP